MNLTDLQTFSYVVQAGTISGAALKLGLPKSTVSRRIQRLEDELALELFQRAPRAILLTAEGEALYQRVARSLQELDEVRVQLRERDNEPAGILRITTTPDYAQSPDMISCISSFREQYPKVELELILSDQVINLSEESIDIGLRLHSGALSGGANLMARKLKIFRSGIYASPDYLHRMGTPLQLSELENHTIIGHSQARFQDNPWVVNDKPIQKLCFPRPKIRVNNSEVMLQLACRGSGLAILNIDKAEYFVRKKELVRLLSEYEQRAARVSLVWVASKHLSPKIRAFIDHAVEHIGEEKLILNQPNLYLEVKS